MWGKSKGIICRYDCFHNYTHLHHRMKRGFVNSLVFLYWHFLCGQCSGFVQAPGTCTQLCSVMESQACVSWLLETSEEKGDLGEDESAGDREHCVFCGAVLRGRGGHSNACMASPEADLLEHGKNVQQENESLGVKYNSHAIVEYKFWEGRGGEGGNHAVAAMETKSSPSQGDVAKSWAAWLLLTSQASPPLLPTSLLSPETLTVSRPCVQKLRVMKLQQCSANLPGRIYSASLWEMPEAF